MGYFANRRMRKQNQQDEVAMARWTSIDKTWAEAQEKLSIAIEASAMIQSS